MLSRIYPVLTNAQRLIRRNREGEVVADYPDVYADGYAVAVGQYGMTLTLVASQPPAQEGINADNAIVARVRLSKELAKDLAKALNNAVQTQPVGGQQTKTAH